MKRIIISSLTFLATATNLLCQAPAADTIVAPSIAATPAMTSITITVTDTSGEPVIGATVESPDNPEAKAVSDADGRISLSGVSAGERFRLSAIGYRPEKLRIKSGKENYHVVMQNNVSELDEVVVVGYATQKKVDLTGAVSSVGSSAL